MKKNLWWIILLGVVVLFGLYLWSGYNGLVTANEAVDNQWAKVQTEYQRRFDLIPNLVSAVQGAMKQETAVFGAIADARTKYGQAQTVDEKAAAAGQVESALSRLLVVMENYPQLKSIDAVQTLMAQLEGTENRISVERLRFNDEVKNFNVMVKVFPKNIVAGMFGFHDRAYFQADSGAATAPKVNLTQ